MKRNFGSCMLAAVFGLPIFLLIFIATLYVANCGLSTDCSQVGLPAIIHTPIPTMIPATLPSLGRASQAEAKADCLVSARYLLSSWVTSGYSETNSFEFRDNNGNVCQATFTDVMPLFSQANLWYKGALACDSCHNADISVAAANLDLSSYSGIIAGSKRTPPSGSGEDILGGGNWDNSLLNKVIFEYKLMPFGHPQGVIAPDGPSIPAGMLVTQPITTPTQVSEVEATVPAAEQVARPSNPGGPGEAITLTGDTTAGQDIFANHCQVCHGLQGAGNVLNPGSDDGTVPPINPIDSTLVSPDYKTFVYNVDLFMQNGSNPEGPNVTFVMPAWGARGALTQQQIADVIAYIISLNK